MSDGAPDTNEHHDDGLILPFPDEIDQRTGDETHVYRISAVDGMTLGTFVADDDGNQALLARWHQLRRWGTGRWIATWNGATGELRCGRWMRSDDAEMVINYHWANDQWP